MWLFKPVTTAEDNRLLRCSCGDLLWMKSPQQIMAQHAGHQMRVASKGSWWEGLKLKMGLIK